MTNDLAKWLLKQYKLLATDEMPDLHLRTCQTHKLMPRGAPLTFGRDTPMSCNCPALDWWLKDLAAKKKIVKYHLPDTLPDGTPGNDPLSCETCDNWAWPCPTLRLLAVAIAHRPGYREEWRP